MMKNTELFKIMQQKLHEIAEDVHLTDEQIKVIEDSVINVGIVEHEKAKLARLKIEPIDEKHVKFNNRIYYNYAGGYFHRSERLHITIYELYHNCIVPAGYEIHHRDLNPRNNDISNLQMLTKSEHKSLHMRIHQTMTRKCFTCGKRFTARFSSKKFCSIKCSHFVYKHRWKGHLGDDFIFPLEYLQSNAGKQMLQKSQRARKYIELHPTPGFKLDK